MRLLQMLAVELQNSVLLGSEQKLSGREWQQGSDVAGCGIAREYLHKIVTARPKQAGAASCRPELGFAGTSRPHGECGDRRWWKLDTNSILLFRNSIAGVDADPGGTRDVEVSAVRNGIG